MSLLFGLVCMLVAGWTMLGVPMGSAISWCAGFTSVVGSFFIFIGLVKGELGE